MQFKDRLKQARMNAGLTQRDLAKLTGMTERSIQNYEAGTRKPQHMDVIEKLAQALNVTVCDLSDNADAYVMDAYKKGGSKAAREVSELVSDLTGLFAGGELDDAEKDAVMAALSEAYWKAKENNKKYTPNKYKKKSDSQ